MGVAAREEAPETGVMSAVLGDGDRPHGIGVPGGGRTGGGDRMGERAEERERRLEPECGGANRSGWVPTLGHGLARG